MESMQNLIKPCVKCGASIRYSSGKCTPCHRARSAVWAKENPEKLRDRDAAYRAANPEKLKMKNAAYHAANRDKVAVNAAVWYTANRDKAKALCAAYYVANADKAKAYAAAWQKANPEIVRIIQQNRRARKVASGGVLTNGLAEKLFALQKGKCACCKKPLGEKYHLDHIMPLALGGSNTDDNIQLLRQRCNHQKSAKHPIDFMQQRGMLL